jgi:hypothetical protein
MQISARHSSPYVELVVITCINKTLQNIIGQITMGYIISVAKIANQTKHELTYVDWCSFPVS